MNITFSNSKMLRTAIFAVLQLACSYAHGDMADDVMKYTDSQTKYLARKMAESVAKTLPTQLDSTTKMMSTLFVADTMTFIYKYDSTIPLDPSKLASYPARHNCADRILKALMYRGVTFQHVYLTPIGQQSALVAYKDCR